MNVYIGVSYEYTYRVYVHSRAHITHARSKHRSARTHTHTRIHVHERALTPLLDLGRIELGSGGKGQDGCPEERRHGLEPYIHANIYTSAHIVNQAIYRHKFVRIQKYTDVYFYVYLLNAPPLRREGARRRASPCSATPFATPTCVYVHRISTCVYPVHVCHVCQVHV